MIIPPEVARGLAEVIGIGQNQINVLLTEETSVLRKSVQQVANDLMRVMQVTDGNRDE